MRIDVGTDNARFLQDGERQWTADVVGRTITWTVDLLADQLAFFRADTDVFERAFIYPELICQRQRTDLRKMASFQ